MYRALMCVACAGSCSECVDCVRCRRLQFCDSMDGGGSSVCRTWLDARGSHM